MPGIHLYDTTLRDGAQREGISFSVKDKLLIAQKLDELGVHYIEGGWPGSNPKDAEFYAQVGTLKLKQAKLAVFGSTRRPGVRAEGDANLQAMLETGSPVAAIVGKSWDLHVTQVLGTTLEENLAMIADSVAYLKGKGLTVFLDAEHYFDGFKANKEYALQTVMAAARAGADAVVLCDTNGGALTTGVVAAVQAAKAAGVPLGIHAHNDSELAVANTLAAVRAGATQVQGTMNGYGERCGNANLCSVIANLQVKMGIRCVSDEQLGRLTEVSHFVAEVANLIPDPHLPYVGSSAFGHKAGYHVDALMKVEESYQHIDPETVGNWKRVLVSELSGRDNILYNARRLGIELDSKIARNVAEEVKRLENEGYHFEGAEASFELLLRRASPGYRPAFHLVDFLVLVEKHRRPPSDGGNDEHMLTEATVKLRVGDEVVHTVAEGVGPVNALDAALRHALRSFYPLITAGRLIDYKVRIIDEVGGTGSRVRVLIESTDGVDDWHTVGSSANIIEASWRALSNSLEYWLLRKGARA